MYFDQLTGASQKDGKIVLTPKKMILFSERMQSTRLLEIHLVIIVLDLLCVKRSANLPPDPQEGNDTV